MPGLGLAAWAAIASLAATGATVGDEVYNSVNQPNTAALEKQQQQAQANQEALQKQQAIVAQQGNAQAQTGGALTDAGFQNFVDQLAGYPGGGGTTNPGTISTASQQTPGSAPQGQQPDLQALLKQLVAGNSSDISGGSTGNQPPPSQGFFELSSPVA